ncbi:recombinase family protein [Lactococcus lactis]|uniref:recombinase family protein n=1 Tax=Lactococcus lactis TaxID=1358 RepID=UPI001F0B8988|nr:recombinase family protein [Lactococcus lactis]
MENKEIIKIEPTLYPKIKSAHKKHGKLKVDAYARVSTEKDNQTHSLIAQKEHYTKVTKTNEEWEFAGLFADEGLSGTSFRKRVAFQEMIEKAKSGEVEYIITKSISRFARNTVDTLKSIRMLKSIGVGVWFEKEGIDTLDAKGEFVITLMSSLAQEESRSISENCTWGIRKQFANGGARMPFSSVLGFKRGVHGEFLVDQEQAKTVRAMFAMSVIGMTPAEIRDKLNELGITTAYGKKWNTTSTIKNMLTNEKYIGDALLQKTLTVDYLTKQKKKNEGELPQYYVEGHHESIVSKEVFGYVGVRLKNQVVRGSKIPLTGKIFCGICGNRFGPRTWHATNSKDKQYKYRARKRLTACEVPHVYDKQLSLMLDEAIQQVLFQRSDLIEVLNEILGFVVGEKIADFKNWNREDVALIAEKIVVSKDRKLMITFLDGSEVKIKMDV